MKKKKQTPKEIRIGPITTVAYVIGTFALVGLLLASCAPPAGAQGYDPYMQQRQMEMQQISWQLQQLQQQLQQLSMIPQYMGRPLTPQEVYYAQQIQQQMQMLQQRLSCLQQGAC